jgi:hypothetical protein
MRHHEKVHLFYNAYFIQAHTATCNIVLPARDHYCIFACLPDLNEGTALWSKQSNLRRFIDVLVLVPVFVGRNTGTVYCMIQYPTTTTVSHWKQTNNPLSTTYIHKSIHR